MYRIVEAKPRQRPVRTLELRVRLRTHAPANEVADVANRIRDSVARVHRDLWAIRIFFYGPRTVTNWAYDIARFVWGPNGQMDLTGTVRAPHKWSSDYVPPSPPSTLAASGRQAQRGVPLPVGVTRIGSRTVRTVLYEDFQTSHTRQEIEAFFRQYLPASGFRLTPRQLDTYTVAFCADNRLGAIEWTKDKPGVFSISFVSDDVGVCEPG
jgi:hypothetical protein